MTPIDHLNPPAIKHPSHIRKRRIHPPPSPPLPHCHVGRVPLKHPEVSRSIWKHLEASGSIWKVPREVDAGDTSLGILEEIL